MPNAGLAGKVAIVTGGASGLGLATVRMLAAAGASIVAIGRQATRLTALRDEVPADRLLLHAASVAEEAEVADDGKDWKIDGTHGPTHTVSFAAEKATWMPLDVHPDGSSGTPVPPATAGTPVTYPLSLTVTFVNDSTQFSGITTNLIRTTDDPAAPPVPAAPPPPEPAFPAAPPAGPPSKAAPQVAPPMPAPGGPAAPAASRAGSRVCSVSRAVRWSAVDAMYKAIFSGW